VKVRRNRFFTNLAFHGEERLPVVTELEKVPCHHIFEPGPTDEDHFLSEVIFDMYS
jgi:hypothetical protein